LVSAERTILRKVYIVATALTEIKVTPEIAAEHGVTAEEYARNPEKFSAANPT